MALKQRDYKEIKNNIPDKSDAEYVNIAYYGTQQDPLPVTMVNYPLNTAGGIAGGTNAADPIVLDINGLPQETSIQEGIDFVVLYDVSAGIHVKVLISDLVPGSMQLIGEIADANLNPGFPATPNIGDVWIITTTAGTVGGVTVEIGDQLIYSTSGWFVVQTNVTEATQAEMEAGTATGFKFASPTTTNPANYTNHSGVFTGGDRIRMWSNNDNAVVGVIPQSIADLANEFITLTEAAFLALETGVLIVEGQKYEVTNAGYIEPAFLLGGPNNTYVNLDNSGVAEYDITGITTYDFTNISLARKIRLVTTGTSELLGQITNNQLLYGNKLYLIQNTVTTAPSGLEQHGIGMFVGTPFKLFNRNYDGTVIPGAAISIYQSSTLLFEGIDYNVISIGADTYIDPLVSYPASFIEADYSYIPNTRLSLSLASVYDAISLAAPDAIIGDYGHQRLLYAYSLNTDENDYIEVVKGPQYNNVNHTRVVSDIISDPTARTANVEITFNVSDEQFQNEIVAQGKLVGGRLYRISTPTAIEFIDVRAIDISNWFIENNSKGEPSGLCQLDTSTHLAAGILDISTAKYARRINVTSANPTEVIQGITGGLIGHTYEIRFSGSYNVHVFGKELADAITTGIILQDSDYAFFQGNADVEQSDILTVRETSGMYVQVEKGLVPSLSKEVAISSHEFMRVLDVGQIQYVAVAGGSNVNTTVLTDNQLGIINSNIGAGATSRAGWGGEVGSNRIRLSTKPTVWRGGFTIEVNLASIANPYIYRHGLMDNLTTASLQACQFVHDTTSPNWMIRTAAGGVVTNFDSGYVVSAGVNYKTLIVATDTEVHFAMGVYGSSMNYLGSINTNIPTPVFGILSYGAFAIKTALGGLNTISSDYYSLSKYVNR